MHISLILFLIFSLVLPDKFGAAMSIVKSDIGGNITVRNVYSFVSFTNKLGFSGFRLIGYHDVASPSPNCLLFFPMICLFGND